MYFELKENKPHGTKDDPFSTYHIENAGRSFQIPVHWHDEFELGYNYYQCGVCKLCADENCPELAKYLCQLDFVMADMMGITLKRTQTIAEGAQYCDFRYSKK